MNDEGRRHSAPATYALREQDDTRPPALVIEFELERLPRVLNAAELTEGELRRLIDWIATHDEVLAHALDKWLARRATRRAA